MNGAKVANERRVVIKKQTFFQTAVPRERSHSLQEIRKKEGLEGTFAPCPWVEYG